MAIITRQRRSDLIGYVVVAFQHSGEVHMFSSAADEAGARELLRITADVMDRKAALPPEGPET